jgi:hypothetical protein
MKKSTLLFLLVLCVYGLSAPVAGDKPDFIAVDILVQADQFIHIKLQNKSAGDCVIPPELKEKIFLTIYINNIKRADYKIKYIDSKLFKAKGTILFPTNFRVQKGLNIAVEINPLKVIPESDYLNNKRVKRFD